ncbi:MAG: hypothetical protein UHN47_06980 [Lachnospiraceae bacterium]|nr:hypothetical protein [Lachnospiraceae bacterium]
MAFGNNTARPISKPKAPDLDAFESIAKEYDLSNEVDTKETSVKTEKPELITKKGEIKEPQNTIKKEVTETKKTEKPKTSQKKEKQTPAYYKNFYNLRVDLPKQVEPLLELAAQVYGSKKDYIIKLIHDDMKKNVGQYRQAVKEKPTDDWDF